MVPLHRRLQCPSRAAFLRVNGRLTRHFTEDARSSTPNLPSALDTSIPNLSIVDAPYRAASRHL